MGRVAGREWSKLRSCQCAAAKRSNKVCKPLILCWHLTRNTLYSERHHLSVLDAVEQVES